MVVCLGGGEWGAKAARIAKNNRANAIVIDKSSNCLARELADKVIAEQDLRRLDLEGVVFCVGDAVAALIGILKLTTHAWIIPAIAGGFSGQLIERWLATKGFKVTRSGKLLNSTLRGLPPKLVLSADRRSGALITSYMPKEIRCKPDCSAPKRCPVTGRRRVSPIYELLEFAICEVVEHYRIFVTKQLGGIGGIPGSEIREALDYIDRFTPPYSLAIGTSCKCHGLMDFFEVRSPTQ